MSFLLMVPLTITEDTLAFSSEPEDTNPEWSPSTTYPVGAIVSVAATHRRYKSSAAGNLGNDPVTATSSWTDYGPTNRFAMFDQKISTRTVGQSDVLTVHIRPGTVTLATFFGLVGTAIELRMIDYTTGEVLKEAELKYLDAVPIIDWLTYWTAPFIYKPEAMFSDLPACNTCELQIKVYGDVANGLPPSVGITAVGSYVSFGSAKFGMKIGFIDFSLRERNATTGDVTFVVGDSAKELTLPLEVDGSMLSVALAMLDAVRATPCVWIPLVDDRYVATMVYGYMEDHSGVIEHDAVHFHTINVKGLT